MIYEIAEIQIKPDTHAAFEAAVAQALPLFKRSQGCQALRLNRLVERPDTYQLVVQWNTLDDHIVHFRGSAEFQTWRELVGGFFAAPPKVEHSQNVLRGF